MTGFDQLSNIEFHSGASTPRRWMYMNSPQVVHSISCRQMYLRSYTFTREDENTLRDKARKCLGRLRKGMVNRRLTVLRKARDVSRIVLLSICSRLISCTAKIDVATQ